MWVNSYKIPNERVVGSSAWDIDNPIVILSVRPWLDSVKAEFRARWRTMGRPLV